MKLYRFANNMYESVDTQLFYEYESVRVYLHDFDVDKTTLCGSWIVLSTGNRKFINHTKTKQFAYKTIDEARISFLARKRLQIKILNAQLSIAKTSIIAIETEPRDYVEYCKFDGSEY